MTKNADAGHVALVTGAGSGIGAAVCRRLAGPGARLVIHTRANRAGLKALAKELQAAGAEVRSVIGDMARDKTAAALVAAAVDSFGRVDHVVSNAGFPDRTPIGKLTAAGLHQSLDAMTGGFLRLATAVLPLINNSPRGRIVAVTSHTAHTFRLGGLRFPATAAAKAGIEALAKSLAAQVSPTGTTVNCVVPGFIRTGAGLYGDEDGQGRHYAPQMVPLGRLGTVDEVAATVAFLLSADAGYITGQSIHVSGGIDL